MTPTCKRFYRASKAFATHLKMGKAVNSVVIPKVWARLTDRFHVRGTSVMKQKRPKYGMTLTLVSIIGILGYAILL